MATTTTCILCFQVLHREKNKGNDFNLVAGKGETNIENELQLLNVYIVPTSKYICRKCLGLIKRRVGHRKKLEDIDREIGQLYHEGYTKNITEFNQRSAKRALFDETLAEEVSAKKPLTSHEESTTTRSEPIMTTILSSEGTSQRPRNLTSTPASMKRPPPIVIIEGVKEKSEPEVCKENAKSTTAFIKVVWKSQTREKKLPADLLSLGTMLCRGTYRQIAAAAWRNDKLRVHLVESFLKAVDAECCRLCSGPRPKKPMDSIRGAKVAAKKNEDRGKDGSLPAKGKESYEPSCLRLTKKEDILSFSIEKFSKELEERAPLTRSILVTMCHRRSKHKENDLFISPAVCMAAAVCLKNRSNRMIALQLIISIMLQHSGFMVSSSILKFRKYPA